jgi:hypothetical protein
MKNGDVPSGRVVFISLSALIERQVPTDVLENALFFFGSKRFWLWPTDDAERKESKAQPTDYLNMSNELKDLILRKERRGEVCFLKPDLLGAPDEVVFGDYARASRWLEERGYNPLRLGNLYAALFKAAFANTSFFYRFCLVGKHKQRQILEECCCQL